MKIKTEVDKDATIDNMLVGLREVKQGLKLQMFRALTILEAAIKDNIRSKSGLKVRTGRLLNSVKKEIVEEGDTLYGEVGTEGVPYAGIHEFGGTITPKNAQNLTIPTSRNRRADGSPRMSIRDVFATKKAFIAKGIVFLKKSKDDIEPMFILKKSVTIPARPYIQPALAAKKEQILKDFGLFLVAAFEKGGK